MVRQGGWRKNGRKEVLVLVFVVASDMAIIELKRKCDEVGLYCFAIGTAERKGEHFRVTLKPKASKEWQWMDRQSIGTS